MARVHCSSPPQTFQPAPRRHGNGSGKTPLPVARKPLTSLHCGIGHHEPCSQRTFHVHGFFSSSLAFLFPKRGDMSAKKTQEGVLFPISPGCVRYTMRAVGAKTTPSLATRCNNCNPPLGFKRRVARCAGWVWDGWYCAIAWVLGTGVSAAPMIPASPPMPVHAGGIGSRKRASLPWAEGGGGSDRLLLG